MAQSKGRWLQQISPPHAIFQTKDGRTGPTGYPGAGVSLNNLSDEELALLDLQPYVKPVVVPDPYVHTVEDRINQLDAKCREVVDELHWSSGPMVFDKAKAGKPKSKSLNDWVEACWNQRFTNSATLEQSGVDAWDEAMLDYPEKPCSIVEAMQE